MLNISVSYPVSKIYTSYNNVDFELVSKRTFYHSKKCVFCLDSLQYDSPSLYFIPLSLMTHVTVNNTNMKVLLFEPQPTITRSNSLMSLSPKFGSAHGKLAIRLNLTRWLYQLQ